LTADKVGISQHWRWQSWSLLAGCLGRRDKHCDVVQLASLKLSTFADHTQVLMTSALRVPEAFDWRCPIAISGWEARVEVSRGESEALDWFSQESRLSFRLVIATTAAEPVTERSTLSAPVSQHHRHCGELPDWEQSLLERR